MRKEETLYFQMAFLPEKEVKNTERYMKTASNSRITEKMHLCQDNNWCEEVEVRPILKIRENLISVVWM